MLHLQILDRVRNDGGGADVAGMQDIGNVAMHEDIARDPAEDGGLGHATVGTADPEDGRGLALGVLFQEVRVLVGMGIGPLFVGGEMLVKIACGWGSG